MKRKTKSIIAGVCACAVVGVAGFALAGGFQPKEEARDFLSTDGNYTQKVDSVSYVMSTNIDGVKYDLPDPLIVNDTYYFTLEVPTEDITIDKTDASTVEFKFVRFDVNYGELELINEDPLQFRLKVAAKDVSLLKVIAVFEEKVNIKVDDNTAII